MPHPTPPVQPQADRVIFVRQQFSQFGGAELILDRMLIALAARGRRVALLGRSWRGGRDIEFIRCDPPKVNRAYREKLFARAACRLIAREKGALVQAHERIPCCDIFRAGDGVHAAYLAARARRLGFFSRKLQDMSTYHRNILGLERTLFTSKRLKGVIAISRMVADDLVREYGYPREKIHHIPNGIDLNRFSIDSRRYRHQIRNQLGVSLDKPVILFVGSGFARKGLDFAIAATARSRIGAELWVIGHDRRPGYFAALAQKAGLGERYRNFGSQTDPVPWYGAADISILPSVYEPFGSTVIEAMACGLPTVVSNDCGAREMVEQLDPKLVREGTDVLGLAEALERAFDITTTPLRSQTVRLVAENYALCKMVEGQMALYERISQQLE